MLTAVRRRPHRAAAATGMAFDDTFEVDDETYSLRLVYVRMIAEPNRHS